MKRRFISILLLFLLFLTNLSVFAESVANKTINSGEEVKILPKKLDAEINNAIEAIYGEVKAPEIYDKVMEIAHKAITNRSEELKKEDFSRSESWYKNEIIYMFYVDQFGVVSPEKPNQFKDTAEMFEYLQDLMYILLI